MVQAGVHQAEVERAIVEGQSFGVLPAPRERRLSVSVRRRVEVGDDDVPELLLTQQPLVPAAAADDEQLHLARQDPRPEELVDHLFIEIPHASRPFRPRGVRSGFGSELVTLGTYETGSGRITQNPASTR